MENTHVMSARTSIDPAGSNDNAKSSSSQTKRVAPSSRNQVDADMAMYTAIMGRPPEIDPTAPDMLETAPAPTASAEMRSARNGGGGAWSPIVLSIYLRDIARQGALKLNRPEIAAWIRRQSVVALRRLHESHVRLISVRQKDRAA
jgi:hypothetical protein